MSWEVREGDCVEAMRAMPEASVDSIVCDPPYGLEFMGKEWDALGAHAEARTRRAAEVTPTGQGHSTSAGPYLAAGVNGFGKNGPAMQRWHEAWAREALRVLKPGGHLLAFGGTRTFHRLACAIEDAGFEIRDCLAWLYGSGFPKSLDVSKAIDKMDAAAERDARAKRSQAWLREHVTPQQVNAQTGTDMGHHLTTHPTQPFVPTPSMLDTLRPLLPPVPEWLEVLVRERAVESENMKRREVVAEGSGSTMPGFAKIANGEPTTWDVTQPHTPEAEQWQGWGTALKPAHEPIVMARKPLAGTVAANVLEHGTGALNVDGCRIEGDEPQPFGSPRKSVGGLMNGTDEPREQYESNPAGRWPANVLLDEQAAEMLDEQTGELTSGEPGIKRGGNNGAAYGAESRPPGTRMGGFGDSGGASRFLYVAKASSAERNAGLDGFAEGERQKYGSIRQDRGNGYEEASTGRNSHPTVKPIELMRWLVRLVTPPGGVVLDTFAGSGTTGCATVLERLNFIGIERESEYVAIARARVGWWEQHPEGLEIVKSLEADRVRRAVADSGQLGLLG